MIETALLAIFATFRITLLLVIEDGPYSIFKRLRNAVGITEIQLPDGTEITEIVKETLLTGILSCFYCCSIWVAVFVSLLILSDIGSILLLPFAISGGAIVLLKVID